MNNSLDDLIKRISKNNEKITLLHEMYSGYSVQVPMHYIAIVTIEYYQYNKPSSYLLKIDTEFSKVTNGIITKHKIEDSQFVDSAMTAFELAGNAIENNFKLNRDTIIQLRQIWILMYAHFAAILHN